MAKSNPDKQASELVKMKQKLGLAEHRLEEAVKAKNDAFAERDKAIEIKEGALERVAKLSTENKALRAKIEKMESQKKSADLPEDETLEVVEVPPFKGAKLPPRKVDGVPVEPRYDENNSKIYRLPKAQAVQLLLNDQNGLYRLYGPVDMVKGKRRKGLYTEEVTIRRHVARARPNGEVEWIPVKVEGE